MSRRNSAPQAVAQPMTQPSSRSPMDWSGRARTSVKESKRYTRFVGVMKRVLFFAAMAILAIVVAYSVQPRRQDKVALAVKTVLINNDLTMDKPHLTGLDNQGNPYVVTAEKAVQDARNTRRARLIAVDADLTDKKKGTWTTLTAPTGLLDANAHTLHLNGPIASYSDDGYEMHTMVAEIDLQGGIVRGSRMIVGPGPLGHMRADRVWLNRKTRLVFLNGNVRMTLFPKAMKKGKKP